MIEWIAKYWIEVVFGLICTGISAYFKFKADKRKFKQEKFDEVLDKKFQKQQDGLHTQMKACYKELNDTIQEHNERLLQADEEIHKDIDVLRGGLLSVQGREFKTDCRYLLSEGHKITLSEYENINEEYRVYKTLMGNHEGDALYKMVVTKYEQSLNLESK